jgi:hypothetical protein
MIMGKTQVIGLYIFIKAQVLTISAVLFDSHWITIMIFGIVSIIGISIMYWSAKE